MKRPGLSTGRGIHRGERCRSRDLKGMNAHPALNCQIKDLRGANLEAIA